MTKLAPAVRVVDTWTFRLRCERCGTEWIGVRGSMTCQTCNPKKETKKP